MEIRKFKYEDIESVFNLAKKYLRESYTFELFLYLWQISPDGFLVAEKNGKIIGFIVAVKTSKDSLRILMLAVDENYRKRGVGSRLLKKIILNFSDVRRIYLETRTDNIEAIEFYKKNGFKIVEKVKDFYTDGGEAYIMEKIIF